MPQRIPIVIVTGPPGAGKGTFMRAVSEGLQWPLFSKDQLKEILFDQLGSESRNDSRRYGVATFEQLGYLLEQQLKVGKSCVLETAFIPKFWDPRVVEFVENYNAYFVQVFLTADDDVLKKRFVERAQTQERHDGHFDTALDAQEEYVRDLEARKWRPLTVNGPTFTVDTTDQLAFSADSQAQFVQDVRAAVSFE